MTADPVASLVLAIALVLVAAKLGGDLAARVGQPPVLGELVIGVLLGNLPGIGQWAALRHDAGLEVLAELGVLILLFEVGLESTVSEMVKVGLSSALVAVLGVAAPFGLGWAVSALLLPSEGAAVHAFIGATLCATSVGITARVLKDLDRVNAPEGKIILGAAVIDDVLGLVILAVVTGVIESAGRGSKLSYAHIARIFGEAALFLVGALLLGRWLSPPLFRLAARLRSRDVLLSLGLSFCFALSWLADFVGLAPIVGAFAAGLLLEDSHYREYVRRGEPSLEERIHPISSFLVPIFFVLMGVRTDLGAFFHGDTLALAGGLTLVAILGKQLCSAGVVVRGVDRLAVGIGMVPRGEVGLIFANIGLTLTVAGERVITPATFSALVVMIIITTLITPPALKWRLARARRL